MPVLTKSVTYNTLEVRRRKILDIRRAAMQQLAEVATAGLKGADVVIRDLLPTDLGLTNNEWTETSGSSDNAYATTTIDATLADGLFIAIWGVRIISVPGSGDLGPVVSEFRFTVGNSVVAKWNLYPLWAIVNPDNAEAVLHTPRACITESPIIATQRQPIKIEEYVLETSTTYRAAFEGAAAEKVEAKVVPQRGIPGL